MEDNSKKDRLLFTVAYTIGLGAVVALVSKFIFDLLKDIRTKER